MCSDLVAPSRKTLYTPLVRDGAGSTVTVLLEGAMYAYARDVKWGGAIAPRRSQFLKLNRPPEEQPHRVDPWRAIDFVFGDTSIVLDRLYDRDCSQVKDPDVLERLNLVTHDHEAVFFTNARVPLPAHRNSLREERFKAALRRGARCRVESFRPRLAFDARAGLSVAVHLRRGDVTEAMKSRWVDADCVFDALEWIRRVYDESLEDRRRTLRSEVPLRLAAVDAHVFSSLSRTAVVGRPWTEKDFYGFDQRDIAVHLARDSDGDATNVTLDHWAHFALADVLLAGASNFSLPAAMLNANCVIRPTKLTPQATSLCYDLDDVARRCVERAIRRKRHRTR